MIVDKIWKLTNTVKVGLAPRSSHSQRQATFQDNVCSWASVLGIRIREGLAKAKSSGLPRMMRVGNL
jgi:hypothetical protein